VWFELNSPLDADVLCMIQVYPVRDDKRPPIPVVTYLDGTGRLQAVSEADNGRYYRLIRRFYKRTGAPMVLATSFNVNDPIVCTPRQALGCFVRTKLDVILLDDLLKRRDA